MKVYKVYVEVDNEIKVIEVLAKSRRSLTLPNELNGEVIKVKEVTEQYKSDISETIKNLDETEYDLSKIKNVLKSVELL